MSKLKPCPFCGHTEALYTGHSDRSMVCMSCSARSPRVNPFTHSLEEWADIAADLWNTRYTQAEVDTTEARK